MASALEELLKIRQAQQDREAKLFTQVKGELMERYSELKADFNTLGIPFPGNRPGVSTGGRVKRQRDPNKPCGVCGFLTSPSHDGRMHRAQGNNKKPFTAKELEAMEMYRQ